MEDEEYSKMFQTGVTKEMLGVREPVTSFSTCVMRDGEVRVNRIKFKKFYDGNLFINLKKGRNRMTNKKNQLSMVIYESEALKLRDWLNEHYPPSQD